MDNLHQLDITATGPDWFTIPRHAPGRLSTIDFVFFHWPASIDPSRYTVAVESLDVAGPTHRGISKLRKSVELPHVQYGWNAKIGVIPDSASLPSFHAKLGRGNTYIIPDTRGRNGVFEMERHGVDAPTGL